MAFVRWGFDSWQKALRGGYYMCVRIVSQPQPQM